jgi:hypothetical protein
VETLFSIEINISFEFKLLTFFELYSTICLIENINFNV